VVQVKIYSIYKWIIDRILAFILVIMLLPIFLVIALMIKIDSKGPVLFKQKRIGRNRRNFFILKFRTMRIDAPKDMPTHLLENPEMFITRVGRILRRTSLDELPQIINILKGEMSIIGPRPALWNQIDLIQEREKFGANNIYPGLTGWAQINGRDELSIHEKAKLDGEYVLKMSLFFDVKVFFLTIWNVVRSNGIKEGTR
jgi:O-antigen biosynthesis protein WbqP